MGGMNQLERRIAGRIIIEGVAQGEALAATEPLSFWGGYSQTTARSLIVVIHFLDKLERDESWSCHSRADLRRPQRFS